jgi:P27 family predicted phage terminase small subunit
MPTPVKTEEKIKKHLTNAERAARQKAEDEITRDKRSWLKCPDWLDDDARKIFEETKRRLKGLHLLDNADVELLGIYCDAVSKYRAASKLLAMVDEEGSPLSTPDDLKACQAWARLIAQYAEKLGLTPTARARLAKRKAELGEPEPAAPDGSYSADDMRYFQEKGHWPWEES